MDPLGVVVGAVLFGGIAYKGWVFHVRRQAIKEGWGKAARELGLTLDSSLGAAQHFRVSGRLDGVDVWASVRVERQSDPLDGIISETVWTNATACPTPPLNHIGFVRSRDPAEVADAKQPGSDEVLIGDLTFDRSFRIDGAEAGTVATLNAAVRELLTSSSQEIEVHVEHGTVTCRRMGFISNEQEIADLIRNATRLAVALTLPPDEVPARLHENVRNDPVAAVRRLNLELLVQHFPTSELASAARATARNDESPEVRLAAVIHSGIDAARDVIEIVSQSDCRPALRAKALEHLTRQHDVDTCLPSIELGLRSGHREFRDAALEAVCWFRRAPRGVELHRLIQPDDDEGALLVGRAMGASGDPAAESVFLRLLRSEDVTVPPAAAAALAVFGTVAAVQPMLQFLNRGYALSKLLQSAVREAVQAIQSKTGGAQPGALSLAETSHDQGTLSLAAEPGSLSVGESVSDGPEGLESNRGERREREASSVAHRGASSAEGARSEAKGNGTPAET